MPNDFMNGNNAGNGKSMSINLDALGDAAKQAVNMGSGEKPILNTEVEAEVSVTDFRLMNELQSNQNDPSKKYFNTVFTIETKFKYVNAAGEEVEASSRDNYGGLRYFPVIGENNEIIRDANGQPQLERLWSGDNSGFGKLFALTQEKDSSVRSYSDFFNFWNREGIRVLIKTQTNNFGGKEFQKNVVTKIL